MLSASLLACLLTLAAPTPPGGGLLATGWDNPSPAAYRAHVAEFAKLPFDGATIRPTRVTAKSKEDDALNAFSSVHWQWSEFAQSLADLKAAKSLAPRLQSYLIVYANPGNVDWFDDAGWKEVVDHWRLLARLAKRAGLAGLCFDGEPYTDNFREFQYSAQPQHARHSFDEYQTKARQRGRELMAAVGREFSDATLYTLWLLAPLERVADHPALLRSHVYGLIPAFADGWLDVMPARMTLVEGDENAYLFNAEATFNAQYVRLRTDVRALLSPENQAKLRTHYVVSHGIYLDAFTNKPDSPWYIASGGESVATHLSTVVGWSLAASDGYTWIYGEQGRWWESGDAKFPRWDEKIPGCSQALLAARDPQLAAETRLKSANPGDNRLANADFAADIKPWDTWQDDGLHGVFDHDQGAAHVRGCDNGCFLQSVDVKPGERYAVSARVRREGAGQAYLQVRWQTAEGKWTEESSDIVAEPSPSAADVQVANVVAPTGAYKLVVLLSVRDQGTTGQAWFDDVRVVAMLDANVK